MAGKNFSGNNLGQRKPSDYYETPFSMTAKILPEIDWAGIHTVLEPAAGNGAILKVLHNSHPACRRQIDGFDLCPPEGSGVIPGDFLGFEGHADLVITNPPFSRSHEFILKAKEVANRYIVFLLPLSYLHGQRRFEEIWQDDRFPLARVHVFVRYPMLGDPLRTDGKYRTGMTVFAWYIWDNQHEGPPVISWIDNNEDILRKSVDTPG